MWALDYQFDQTPDGRILKLLHVVDEHSREALAVHCERRIDADATVAVLDRHGRPPWESTQPQIRCDDGPELTANTLRDWCCFTGAGHELHRSRLALAEPHVESSGSRVRDELLFQELFATLTEAQVLVGEWRSDYDTRPALGARHDGPGPLRRQLAAKWADQSTTLIESGPMRGSGHGVAASRHVPGEPAH